MSTRSWISIKVNPEEVGKKCRFDPDLLPLKLDIHSRWEKDVEYHLPQVHLPFFLSTYCHSDGYPSGVGQELLDNYNSYEKALNLVLGGWFSSIVGFNHHYEDHTETKDMRIVNFLAFVRRNESGQQPDLASVWEEMKPWGNKIEENLDPDYAFKTDKFGHDIEWAYKWSEGKWWVKECHAFEKTKETFPWEPLTEEFIKNH